MAKTPDGSRKLTGLRKQAEELLRATKRESAAMPVTDVQQLVHEMPVHQIELDMQNEELRRAQIALEAARDRYVDLYDFSPAGHLTLDTSGRIVEANLRAATLFGSNRQELIGQSLARFVAREDQALVHRHCQEVVKTGTRNTCEVQLLEKAGGSSCVHLESLAVHEEPGQITQWRTALLDITERKRAGEELWVTKEKLQQALLASKTGLWDWNTDTNELFFSREWKSQLGYGEQDLANAFETWETLMHADDHEKAMAYVRAYLKNPVGDYRQEFRLRHKDGSYRWIAAAASFVVEPDGRRGRLLGSHTDITERKRAEEALRLAKFSVDRAADAVYWIDPQAKILDVNETASLMLGYSKQELCAMTVHDLNPDFQADRWPGFWAETKRRGTLVFETAHRAKNGRLIPIEVSVNYLSYEGKDYHCAFVRDITDRKRAGEELQRSEAFILSVVENLPNMIFVKDAKDLKFVRLNKAGEHLLGHSREVLIGKSDYDLFPKEEADFFTATDRQVLETGDLMDIPEESIQTRDKGERILHTKKIPILDAAGRPQYLLGISEDITERKRLEEQFRQAQKMEAVGRLAGGVAHDFNNLLTVINGYSALLIDQLPPEDPRHRMAVETLQAGERAGELTKQLLAFSRKQVLMPQPLNLNDSMRSISSMLSRLLGEDVMLTMDLAPDLWSINGDKGQLDQVTMNLAINAREAMRNGGQLTIATRNLSVTPERPARHRMTPPGDYVHVSVRDTGHGMMPETLSHLFEPFFTTKSDGKGTGLGLAMVYGIVKQSQGYIFADSASGQGATFHLYYPRVVAAPVVAAPPPVRHGKGAETLLVVEDQDSVRGLIVEVLTREGYRVSAAANGEEALRMAASLPEPAQALVTDVIMPYMSGPVLAERLRRVWPGLRVLFMSGYTDRMKPVLNEPGTAFIQKPFLPDDLARRLRDFLDKSI